MKEVELGSTVLSEYLPCESEMRMNRIAYLEQRLRECIRDEDYRRCAEIRDELRQLQ